MQASFSGLTFSVQTFGCQMNKHDSERIAGLMEEHGATLVANVDESDIVVFMTCCVRESAETRLYGHVNSLKNLPPRKDCPLGRRVIAVGGCIGQREGKRLRETLSHVDVVFGTNNIKDLPSLLLKAIDDETYAAHVVDAANSFSADLPTDRENPWSAWLPITVGCDNFCTYCIVPYVRGREKSRTKEDIENEARRYVSEGVREITLLGQNVNSYGRDLYGSPRFAELLHAIDATGIERLRFATSHPKDLSEDVIRCFGELESLMPALHLPVQSGSDDILRRMNRRYTSKHYLSLIHALREVRPDIALSTDVIIGFPGETNDDFERTCELIDQVGYNQVFTFMYSPRSGTPAAEYEDAIPHDIVQERFDRLFKIVEKRAFEANQADAGRVVEVLVEGPSKRDRSILTGRSPRNLNVHANVPEGSSAEALAGSMVRVRVTDARTWYLFGEVI